MHDTRLSIFILPVLIIGLSIFTTYVEENPSFASLFSISQVANPTSGEEAGQDIEAVVSDAIEEAEEIIEETPQEEIPQEEIPAEEPVTEDSPVENPEVSVEDEIGIGNAQGEPEEEMVVESSPEEESPSVSGGGGSAETEVDVQTEESPEEEVVVSEDTPVEETEIVPEEEIPLEDQELLTKKIAQYEVSKSMISSRFQQNLLRLETTRDELYAKIASMEQSGKDVSRAKDALANLEDAIAQSRRYMRDSSVPESIPAVQKMLVQYVYNIRQSLQTGYTELFNVIKETQ